MILGRVGTGEEVSIDFFAPAHTLITGETRSGKSVQLYGLLAQMKGLPIQLCGVDPTGILFNAVGDGLGGSNMRVSTLRNPSYIREVMTELVSEMDRRIDLLLSKKLDKFDKADFTTEFPLLVVVFEEYPGILATAAAIDTADGLKGKDKVETFIRAAVQRLALEGAKVGFRLVLISQRADASLLTGVLRSQLVQRLAFRQDPDGLRMILDGITPEQVQTAQNFIPGQAFLSIAGEPLRVYRADLLTYERLVRVFER